MDSEPDRPGPAFRIAIAGPLVSIAIGGLSIGLAMGADRIGLSDLTVVAVVWLGLVNLGLAVFNLVPALPLDGGRVLQAALWRRSNDQLLATVKAATVGRVIGNLMMLGGLYLAFSGGSGIWTVFIGWFVSSGAKAEERRARLEILQREAGRTDPAQRGEIIDVD